MLPPRCRWTGDSSIDTSTPVLTEDEAIEALKNMSNIWKHSQVLEQADFVSFESYLIKETPGFQVGFHSKKIGCQHLFMRATNGRVKWRRHLKDSHLEAAALTDEVAFKPKGSSSSSFFFEERIEEILDETCWLVRRVKLVEVELADVCWWIEGGGAGIGESSSLTRMPSGTAEDMARSTTDFFFRKLFTARFQKLQLKNKHLSTCTQIGPTFHSRNLTGCCQTVSLTYISSKIYQFQIIPKYSYFSYNCIEGHYSKINYIGI